jgi:hypothetical protein
LMPLAGSSAGTGAHATNVNTKAVALSAPKACISNLLMKETSLQRFRTTSGIPRTAAVPNTPIHVPAYFINHALQATAGKAEFFRMSGAVKPPSCRASSDARAPKKEFGNVASVAAIPSNNLRAGCNGGMRDVHATEWRFLVTASVERQGGAVRW